MKCQCRKILGAFYSRLLFFLHGIIMVALTVHYTEDKTYLVLFSGIVLLFIEMIVTLKMTRHGEWKWFSPMVFLYLCSVVPSIFVMELKSLEFRKNITNLTNSECKESDYKKLSTEMQSAEELTILVLILARWMMPRGKMSRDQLAQLLMIYLALGADILDILELMKEPSIKTSQTIAVVGLCLFTLAVLQFTIVLTQTSSYSPPETEDTEQSRSSSDERVKSCILNCCTSEVSNMMTSVVMQDGPFLIYRLYLVAREDVFADSITFFICKNILAVIIQVYRAVVYICDENKKRKKLKQAHVNLE
ncbi:transmembrane protein 26-like [Eleutherodactylus coqui]|uniref:transmembrane protein 26-like n=1 Tax=Eleutherodactylus coqui TaxID=57060 RepID=UPI003462C1C1